MPEGTENRAAAAAALAPLLADPGRAGVLLDLDGTLAPIVSRPEDAAITEAVRSSLEAIAARYALAAIVTGRPADVAREIVGLDVLAYAGNHGFEMLAPGATSAQPADALRGHAAAASDFAAGLGAAELEAAGVRLEDKGPIVALHWRRAEDQVRAEQLIARIGADAESAGLVTHGGRMVLELRPRVAIDKGVAVAGLLDGTKVRAALYAGDDRTDLDVFDELERRRDDGRLDSIVRVGVSSAEGPTAIAERSDLVIEGPDEAASLLEVLAA